jgi:TrmH family RNA methyltransferase
MITNRQIRDLAALQKSNVRSEKNQFLIEGRLCVEAALDSGFPLENVLITHEFAQSEHGKDVLSRCAESLTHVEHVPERTLQRISSQEHAQGVLGVGRIREASADWASGDENILLVMSRLSDPGNMGTIFRTAHTFGISTIWVGGGSVDPWHPKVVRGSMGSLFNLNIRRTDTLKGELENLTQRDVRIYALDSNGRIPPNQLPDTGKIVIILGHEAEGIPGELLALCHDRVVLGKPGAGMGSLNVAVAAGIMMYLLKTRNQKN